jgi:hypothetical protein
MAEINNKIMGKYSKSYYLNINDDYSWELKMSLIGAVVSPLIGYIGVTNNNRDIINLSYIIGFSFAFNAIDFKLKSIESLKKAGENFH